MSTNEIIIQADTLEELVFQTLGAMSVCWEHIENAGEFDSTRAALLGNQLMERIREYVKV